MIQSQQGKPFIILEPHELWLAVQTGSSRKVRHRGKYNPSGPRAIGWTEDIEGAAGEIAVAKFLNVYYDSALGVNDAPDINAGLPVEVRTRSRHWYDLIIHPNDKDNSFYVLVTGTSLEGFTLRGYISGKDGKQEMYWGEKGQIGRPAYFVPQSKLRPMHELRNVHNLTPSNIF